LTFVVYISNMFEVTFMSIYKSVLIWLIEVKNNKYFGL